MPHSTDEPNGFYDADVSGNTDTSDNAGVAENAEVSRDADTSSNVDMSWLWDDQNWTGNPPGLGVPNDHTVDGVPTPAPQCCCERLKHLYWYISCNTPGLLELGCCCRALGHFGGDGTDERTQPRLNEGGGDSANQQLSIQDRTEPIDIPQQRQQQQQQNMSEGGVLPVKPGSPPQPISPLADAARRGYSSMSEYNRDRERGLLRDEPSASSSRRNNEGEHGRGSKGGKGAPTGGDGSDDSAESEGLYFGPMEGMDSSTARIHRPIPTRPRGAQEGGQTHNRLSVRTPQQRAEGRLHSFVGAEWPASRAARTSQHHASESHGGPVDQPVHENREISNRPRTLSQGFFSSRLGALTFPWNRAKPHDAKTRVSGTHYPPRDID